MTPSNDQQSTASLYFDHSTPLARDYADLQGKPVIRVLMLLFFMASGVALVVGWNLRLEELITADTNLGYNLGVIGSLLMLFLVLYPLRKKARFLQNVGTIKTWFHIHIVFGTLGPTLILFHANFSFGSLNSTLALFFTILVAASGFFHIFIYTKIHFKLHSKKTTLQELQEKTEAKRSSIQHIFTYAPSLKKRLFDFENHVLTTPHGIFHSMARIMTVGSKTWWHYLIISAGLKRGLEITAKRGEWPTEILDDQKKTNQKLLREHMFTVLRIVELNFYEKLCAQWYLFHGPLFYMLIFVAVIHVVAVHMY